MGLLDGKVAIVTGAGHGIGRGHALELAAQGAKVLVNDLGCSLAGDGSSTNDADLTVKLIEQRGGAAAANYDDIADFEGAKRLIDDAVAAFGRLDILVNNAGIARDGMVFKMSEDDWDAVIRVHLKGTFCPTHHAANYWRDQQKAGEKVAGRVINTTSGAGLVGNLGQANYTAAKAGIAAFTQTVSLELARVGVTVNCIAPAGATRMAASIPGAGIERREPDEFTEWDSMDPSISSPVVAWLASDQAAHVTGQVIRAVGDTIMLMQPWSYGPTITSNGKRWDPQTVGALINSDLFNCRAPGLRY